MFFVLFFFPFFSSGQVFPEDSKLERFNACYRIVKLKLSQEKEEIDEFSENFENPDQVVNRISTDMLITCYSSISKKTAEDVLSLGKELYLKDEFHDLTCLDLESYVDEDLTLNHQHLRFYEEIKKIKERAEDNEFQDISPLPEVGNWYVFLVISAFSLLLYYLISKVLPSLQRNSKKNLKKH
jgi:hypothetical protein